MIIDKVTMTGADDSVDVSDLIEISKEYPDVEWGILVSKRQEGSYRFPSLQWLLRLHRKVCNAGIPVNLSMHICGSWVRDLMVGNISIFRERSFLYGLFGRWQFNFHADKHAFDCVALSRLIPQNVQCLFQFDGVNHDILDVARAAGINAAPLFDLSGGAGVLPEEWPKFIPPTCGYAGGLGPDNISEQLRCISMVTEDQDHIWLDMETKIRSPDDAQFDLSAVCNVLEQVKSATPQPA